MLLPINIMLIVKRVCLTSGYIMFTDKVAHFTTNYILVIINGTCFTNNYIIVVKGSCFTIDPNDLDRILCVCIH